MEKRTALSVALSNALGFLIWIAAPLLTGQREAWDDNLYYFSTLFLSAVVLGFVARRLFWLWPIGLITGQLIYIMWLFVQGPGPLIFVGLMILIIEVYPFCLIGSLIGVFIGRRFWRNL